MEALVARIEAIEKTLEEASNQFADAARQFSEMTARMVLIEGGYTMIVSRIDDLEKHKAEKEGSVDTRVLGRPNLFEGNADQW